MAENHSPETILQEALELSDIQERAAWLDEMCGDDEALREEVESLLAAHFAANSDFMDTLADSVLQEAPTEQEGDSIGRYKLLQQIGEDTPVKPSTRLRSATPSQARLQLTERALKGDLDWIVLKAMEKDRTRRYETANALALDVGRHLRDEPVSAGPPSASYLLKKFVRRNRRGLLSGAAAAVALLAGLAVAGGVWLNATVKESRRLAEVEWNASTLIEQTERLTGQNAQADYEDDSHFRQALNFAEQIKVLVDIEEAGEEILERRDQLLKEIESENRDRELILGIEEALMMAVGTEGGRSIPEMSPKAEKAFAEAFQRSGNDPTEMPVDEAFDFIDSKRPQVRDRILAGILGWSYGSPESSGSLRIILRSVDKDPWRSRLYDALEANNRAALEELARRRGSGPVSRGQESGDHGTPNGTP